MSHIVLNTPENNIADFSTETSNNRENKFPIEQQQNHAEIEEAEVERDLMRESSRDFSFMHLSRVFVLAQTHDVSFELVVVLG